MHVRRSYSGRSRVHLAVSTEQVLSQKNESRLGINRFHLSLWVSIVGHMIVIHIALIVISILCSTYTLIHSNIKISKHPRFHSIIIPASNMNVHFSVYTLRSTIKYGWQQHFGFMGHSSRVDRSVTN